MSYDIKLPDGQTYRCPKCGNTKTFTVTADVYCEGTVDGSGEFKWWNSERFDNPDWHKALYCKACDYNHPVEVVDGEPGHAIHTPKTLAVAMNERADKVLTAFIVIQQIIEECYENRMTLTAALDQISKEVEAVR